MTTAASSLNPVKTHNMLPTSVIQSSSVLHPLPWRPLLFPHPPAPAPKLTSPGMGPLLSGQIPGTSPSLPSPRAVPSMNTPERPSRDDLGKSLPIHCLVEEPDSHRKTGGSPSTVDTFAIIPATCLFADLVPHVLIKIGYTPAQSLSAKGQLEVKNWKPLSLESITDQPDATVEQILGDLTSVATLRIRIASRCMAGALDDMKAKLLTFLLQHSHDVLTSLGCPLDKALLAQLRNNDYSQQVPLDTCHAFNKWYFSRSGISDDAQPTSNDLQKTRSNPSSPGNKPPSFMEPCFVTSPGSKLRMRTCFDAEHEIPLLQRWFSENQHPSKEQMAAYLDELNQLESRKCKKPLDIANIIYWFKNARAAQRRDTGPATQKTESSWQNDKSFARNLRGEEETRHRESNEDEDESADEDEVNDRKSEEVPELPNKNAVYVVQPLATEEKEDSEYEVVHLNEESLGNKADRSPCYENRADMVRNDLHHHHHQQQTQHTRKPEGDENHNKCDSLNSQDEATDLTVRARRLSVDSGLQSPYDSLSMRMKLSPHYNRGSKRERDADRDDDDDDDDDDDYSDDHDHNVSSSNSDVASPRRNNDIGKISPAISQPHLGQPPAHNPYGHHALQMAAMSHAFNMGYMHPGSLYGLDPSSPVMANSYKEDSSQNGLDSDRKKRSRVFIDPLSEIPKLEKWFQEDTHPSSYMIEKYTEELNRQTYRQRFPKLEPKNVQLWFKNHRAKVKRQRLEITC